MNSFDAMTQQFTDLVKSAADWKQNYPGAAYSTRLRTAIRVLKAAIKEAEAHEEIGLVE